MNPLLSPFNPPSQVPPFESIMPEHFEPALREGMKIQATKIQEITLNPDSPTFANTISAYEASGKFIREMLNIFFNLNLAHTNPKLQDTAKILNPELSRHGDEIKMNPELFHRVATLWQKKDSLGLDEEQSMLLEKTYKSFARNGANLSEENKSRLKEINSSLASLTLEFGQQVLNDTNANEVWVEDQSLLTGLPENMIASAAQAASAKGRKEAFFFSPNQSTYLNVLTHADNRDLRKAIWTAYTQRGKDSNTLLIPKIVNLRLEKAKLLGFPHYAAYALEDSMAGAAEEVYKLLERLWRPALDQAHKELDALQDKAKAVGIPEVQPHDWLFFAEKIRKEKYDLHEQEILPYFSLGQVQEGVFGVCQQLFGLRFKPAEGLPRYHPDVVAYEVLDVDGTHLGLLYMDFYARSSKQGGAWMTKFRAQRHEGQERIAPVIAIVCNFSPPSDEGISLLNLDEVETFFHEFGHALHGLLSNVQHETLAGTAVPRDFVELPSQLLENWALEPDVMKTYAKHNQTGQSIPDHLIAKLHESKTFNQGYALTEYLAATLLDMAYHTLTEPLEEDIEGFETGILTKYGLNVPVLPRYKSTYFNHIFAGGYAASYYSYVWAEILDADVFRAFSQKHLFDADLAGRFRNSILAQGGSRHAMDMFKEFLGRTPEIAPLLIRKFPQADE